MSDPGYTNPTINAPYTPPVNPPTQTTFTPGASGFTVPPDIFLGAWDPLLHRHLKERFMSDPGYTNPTINAPYTPPPAPVAYDANGDPVPVPNPNARPPWMAGAPEGVAPPPPTYDKFGNPIPPGTEVQPPALAPIGRPVVGTGDISERMAHLEAHVREIWQLLRSSPAIAPPTTVDSAGTSTDPAYTNPKYVAPPVDPNA